MSDDFRELAGEPAPEVLEELRRSAEARRIAELCGEGEPTPASVHHPYGRRREFEDEAQREVGDKQLIRLNRLRDENGQLRKRIEVEIERLTTENQLLRGQLGEPL